MTDEVFTEDELDYGDIPPPPGSCKPCQTLKPVNTNIGSGYGCPVCQQAYIQMNKGTYIEFSLAYDIKKKKEAEAQERIRRANQRMPLQAKPRKKKRRKR